MDNIFNLLFYSGKTVFSIFLIALSGVILVRRNIISRDSLRVLSQLVFFMFLPCLLFTKVTASVNLDQLKEYWVFPASCMIFISFGVMIGKLTVFLCKPREDMRPGVVAAISFSNSGYLPIPLLTAVTVIFPIFADNPKAGDEAVALISMFLLGFSPMLWTVGYSLVSGNKIFEISFKKFFTPPVAGLFLGLAAGLIPGVKSSCIDGILSPFFSAASVIAQATVPAALLVLGGRLADGPVSGIVNKRTIFCVILSKLIIFPAVAILYVVALRHLGLLPANLLAALVLVVEAASPPANNLVVIASLTNQKIEDGIATILFWTYLASVLTLTIVIMVTMWIFAS
jgi:predicted permease